jgi:hypothetical protein
MVKTPAQPFIETPLEDGVYYRRIARPYFDDPPDSIGWNPEDEEQSTHHRKTLIVAENAGQLHHLKEHLEQIAKVVYPRGQNLAAFGHEIRNVLIIACTEVEAQWHGVMKATFCFPKRNGEDRGATHHYAKLLEPLKLNEYCVRFPYFPEIEPIFPFKKWEASDPTQTLDWYAAYNNVKHDREKNFGEAKLIYALTAAAAYFIMLCAQHGREIAAPPEKARTKFFAWHRGRVGKKTTATNRSSEEMIGYSTSAKNFGLKIHRNFWKNALIWFWRKSKN